MPKSAPLLTAGSRGSRRPRRIPPKVRLACQYLVEGAPGGDGEVPQSLGYCEAARLANVRPDTMRRWMHEPVVSSFIKARRAAFVQTLCASNPLALVNIRDRSANDMAKVRAAIALEDLYNIAEGVRPQSDDLPRFTVQIVNRIAPPAPTIDGRTTIPANPPIEPEPEPLPGPVFTPRRWP